MMLNLPFFSNWLKTYPSKIFQENDEYLRTLRNALKNLEIDFLKERRAEESLNDNQNLKYFLNILYKSCKISRTLQSGPLTANLCSLVLKTAIHLKSISPNAIQFLLMELFKDIKGKIQACTNWEDLHKWYGLKTIIQNNTKDCWKFFQDIIDDALKLIFQTDDKNKLKQNLELILSFDSEEQKDFIGLTKYAVEPSLKWIESEKNKLDNDLSDTDTYENFQQNAEELIELIKKVTGDDQDIINKINYIMQGKKKSADSQNKVNYYRDPLLNEFEETEISFSKIDGIELLFHGSDYNEEQSIISIYKGVLDKSTPICFKVYHQKYNNPPNLFLKELKLVRNLSEQSQCFLKYEGWFKELSSYENPEDFSAFAIVIEEFANTLMDDLVKRNINNQKYTYKEYQEIVISLLEAFSFLKSINIMHNNIKPHNILITANNQLKIAEFNLSDTFSKNNQVAYTKNSESLWEDNYLAPEIISIYDNGYVAKKHEDINILEKCDVYSLGLVFLQMYSLLPLSELNTSQFWCEIDSYVSTFQPQSVANLLRKMLKENRVERPSFKEILDSFRNECEISEKMLIEINGPIFNERISNILEELDMINANAVEIYQNPHGFKDLLNGVTVEFLQGFYNENVVLIRTYRSKDFSNLAPYIEEAKFLKKLKGQHIMVPEYYGSVFSCRNCYEFSNLTEWCSKSLMRDMTERRSNERAYSEDELKNYAIQLFEGFIALKQIGYYHRNIKPHNIVFIEDSKLKIAGFWIPEAQIYSECRFPENADHFIQNEVGYSSPNDQNITDRNEFACKRADVFSLGIVLLQMIKLEPINWDKEFKELKNLHPHWLSHILKQMLPYEPSKRKDIEKVFEEMN